MAMRWVVACGVVLLCACENNLCAEVDCRRPATSVCLSDSEMESELAVGTCEPSTGTCVFKTSKQTCNAGERCSEGSCRCDPSRCDGCCQGTACVAASAVRADACGLGGATCVVCSALSVCNSGSCVACPERHVAKANVCVDDDIGIEVSMPNATRTSFVGGVTLWHPGPANALNVNVVAHSAATSLGDSGVSSIDIPVSLTTGSFETSVKVTAESGRTAVYAVNVFATRGVSNAGASACFLTATNELKCGADSLDAGVFVGVGGDCGFTEQGDVWCRRGAAASPWVRAFEGVRGIIDLSPPCARTADGGAVCEEQDGGLTVKASDVRALECRTGACCVLDRAGSASCWGRHEYNLFSPHNTDADKSYELTPVYGLPGQYVRLTSGTKTFFGMTAGGEWSAASNRMGFPTAAPFVLTEATSRTLKLDSPYYCIIGLEEDGGVWRSEYTQVIRQPVDAGPGPFVDFTAGQYPNGFWLLTAARELVEYDCR